MGAVKYLAPILSAASVVLGVASPSGGGGSGCAAPTTTLVTGGDATALAGCATFSGDIVIQTGAAVNNKVSLDGLQEIDGSISYQDDSNVQTFSAATLNKITGTFSFQNMTAMSTISMPELKNANQIIYQGLGSLGALGFNNLETAGFVTVDNTQVTSLQGLSNATQLQGVYIINNQLLNNISLVASKLTSIIIGPNDVTSQQGVAFSAPELTNVGQLVVRNCSSFDVPSLQVASEILELIGNTFDNLMAPNLTWVGGLVINDNTQLTNMSFPALTAVNGSNSTLEVANNTKLTAIGGFNNLELVKGGVDLFGNFSTLTFHHLHHIGGALTVDTAAKSFNCNGLPKTGSIVLGEVKCTFDDSKPATGTSGSGAAGSSSAAMPVQIPASYMPIFGIIAGLLFA